MRLIVSPDAVADLDRLRRFLADKNPQAAQRAVTVIGTAIQSLDTSPGRGRPTPTPGVRELIVPFGRSGYVLRYSHLPDSDEVLNPSHLARPRTPRLTVARASNVPRQPSAPSKMIRHARRRVVTISSDLAHFLRLPEGPLIKRVVGADGRDAADGGQGKSPGPLNLQPRSVASPKSAGLEGRQKARTACRTRVARWYRQAQSPSPREFGRPCCCD